MCRLTIKMKNEEITMSVMAVKKRTVIRNFSRSVSIYLSIYLSIYSLGALYLY